MKKFLFLCFVTGVTLCSITSCRQRTVFILSTNDIHAKIERFPQLAAAVQACRDTADNVLLVDAGDRWTGNPYVDRTPVAGLPVIELMNRLGYDAATLGNHEFDFGQAHLGRILDSVRFAVVAANVRSDTCTFPQLPSYVILRRGGVRIGLVGAVTNYEGPGHPAGNASSFVGLRFPDPQEEAIRCAAELRPKVDLLVLVSHMRDDRDEELLLREKRYDVVIGGHTHVVRNSVINGTLLTQTGKDLHAVGVTEVRMRGRKVKSISFRLVELDEYRPDPAFAGQVAGYYDNEELNRPAGRFVSGASLFGIADWMARSVAERAKADFAFYHRGGVRIDTLAPGAVSKATVYMLEPFNTRIAVLDLTRDEFRDMILAKYNDTCNLKEAHRIDLIASTPYCILTDEQDRATDVLFPELKEGRTYRVAGSEYVYRNYQRVPRETGEVLPVLINDMLIERLSTGGPVEVDNTPKQQVSMLMF